MDGAITSEKCGRCKTCDVLNEGKTFKSTVTNKRYRINSNYNVSCSTSNIVYLVTCKTCGIQYVGKTKQELRTRTGQHRRSFNKLRTHIADHFKDTSHIFSIMPIVHLNPSDYNSVDQCNEELLKEERHWMKELQTLHPYGLNERLEGVGDVSRLDINIESLHNSQSRRKRSHGKRKRSNVYKTWSLDNIMDYTKRMIQAAFIIQGLNFIVYLKM